jgi:hypothetical protein
MIGIIEPQAIEYMIYEAINTNMRANGQRPIHYKRQQLAIELENSLIRPYLYKFLHMLRGYDNIEVYVYTASQSQWAKYIIPIIERILQYRFNRPILTYNDLVKREFKSIMRARDIIYPRLKKKYRLRSSSDITDILLIDNRDDVLIERAHLVKCPDYTNTCPIDYIRHIPVRVLEQYYYHIEDILGIPHHSNVAQFYITYRELIARHTATYSKYQRKPDKDMDDYWRKMCKTFMRYLEYLRINKKEFNIRELIERMNSV